MKPDSPTSSLYSARLELRAMTPQFMRACLIGDNSNAQQILDVNIPAEWPDRSMLALRPLNISQLKTLHLKELLNNHDCLRGTVSALKDTRAVDRRRTWPWSINSA